MNAFVVSGEYHYEGEEVLGVFTTRAKAESFLIEYSNKDEHDPWNYDEYHINEFTMDEEKFNQKSEFLNG